MLKIEIVAQPSGLTGVDMGAQIEEALAAIGFARRTDTAAATVLADVPRNEGAVAAPEAASEAPAAETATEAGKRKRRTKAEIEADKAAEAKQNISVQPENRVEPETAKQDAADEQAESDANASKEATLDDVRDALGKYIEKFGMKAVQDDGSKLFAMLFPDTKPTKLSEIPTDPASLRKVVDGVDEMLEKNPFGRDEVKKG